MGLGIPRVRVGGMKESLNVTSQVVPSVGRSVPLCGSCEQSKLSGRAEAAQHPKAQFFEHAGQLILDP